MARKDYNDIKARVTELAEKRDRTGKKPLSNKKRLQLLNEIYDGLLYLWKQTVVTGVAKGTGAISFQLERARLEMIDLQRTARLVGEDDSEMIVGWNYDPELEKEFQRLQNEDFAASKASHVVTGEA